MERHKIEVYVPLSGFRWEGEDIEFAAGVFIRKLSRFPDLSCLVGNPSGNYFLSGAELQRLRDDVTHWLIFESLEGSDFSAGELANVFALALWLARSTRTHIAFRFESWPGLKGYATVTRLFDRIEYVSGTTHENFTDDCLRKASIYFQKLRIIPKNTRLFMAEILTLQGCWQGYWQSATVLMGAAAETLLTYSRERRLTERLAKSYACLLHAQQPERDAAYDEFRECYETRSDIMHGRGLDVSDDDRLGKLVRWHRILRDLWIYVLTIPGAIEMLNGTDAERKAHFVSLTNGYRQSQ